ncbi:retrovirus-related pol polyprotein from transposon TNT 1-94 [Tanacetum coccineum]
MKTITVLKNDFKKEESRNTDREIALENKIKMLDNIVYKRDQSAQTIHMLTKPKFFFDHSTKQALGFQNPFYLKKAQQLEPKLYDGNVIKNTYAIVIPDSEENLILAEESHSKMLLKQQDPIVLEKKVNTTPVDYNSMNSSEPSPSSTTTKVEVPKELPKVSMVNTSLKKLKHHLAGFDMVVKERITTTTITEGAWGFEHTKACFRDEIIPFVKALKDIFNNFDQYLIDEFTEVQNVFIQMQQAVEQHRLESKTFNVKMNQVLNENEPLLEQVINKDIVNIIMNSSVDNAFVNVHECKKCLKLETKLLNKKHFIEKETYDKLFRSYTTLEKRCISLEVDTQLNQEIFQSDNFVSNQSAPNFGQLFELNELKAQSQEKDTVIIKLKERIKSFSKNGNDDNGNKDMDEIETFNIKLDHMVSKLIAENEHLKQTYKQLNDSIKPTRIRSKEKCDALINQVNQKSVEISDLNANLQEKGLVITSLKNDLRKRKGKALVDNVVTQHTIDPDMLKIDVKPIAPKLLNNRTAHSDYLKHTQEQAAILKEVVEQGKSQNPLNNFLDSACKYTKRIQELLIIIRQTYPSINNSGDKLVAVTPKNKDKRVRFTKPVTSSGNITTKIDPSSNLHSKLNTNSELICVKCNGCIPSDNHDLCVLNSINDVNARAKSKTVKKISKRKVWKPIRKVFTKTGYTLRPTVPLRKLTALETDTPKPVVTLVYSRKPRKSKIHDPVSKPKIIKSLSTNKEPSKSWGSIIYDVPSSSLNECRSSKLFSVKFGNDHVAKIMGYDDYQIRNVTISRVYYVEGLGHNLFSVGQFCDSNLEVAFCQHTCFIHNLEGVNLLIRSRGNNLYTLSLGDMIASSPICLLSKASKTKSWLWHRRLSHMNFSAINHLVKHGLVRGLPKLKFEKDHLCSACAMAKAVATTCYTQNRSIIRLHHGKTPYELLHDKLPDLSFLYVFGALCYPTNDSENLGKLQPKADIDFDELIAMASEYSCSKPTLHELTPTTISSGLVPNPPPSTPFIPPSRTDWDLLFQPLFDELLNPSPTVDLAAPEVIASITEVVAPEPAESTEENHDLDVAHMNNDPFFGIPIPENNSEASSSSEVIHTIMHNAASNSEQVNKWTKDHPLDNIIGELERPVSKRLQLHEQALFCYYDAFFTSVEPKNYKDALTQACWIKAMQEELNEFEHLEV